MTEAAILNELKNLITEFFTQNNPANLSHETQNALRTILRKEYFVKGYQFDTEDEKEEVLEEITEIHVINSPKGGHKNLLMSTMELSQELNLKLSPQTFSGLSNENESEPCSGNAYLFGFLPERHYQLVEENSSLGISFAEALYLFLVAINVGYFNGNDKDEWAGTKKYLIFNKEMVLVFHRDATCQISFAGIEHELDGNDGGHILLVKRYELS